MWTEVVLESDRVKIMRSRTYIRGIVLKYILGAVIATMFAEFVLSGVNEKIRLAIFAVIAVLFVSKFRSTFTQALKNSKLPVLVILDTGVCSESQINFIAASEIVYIEVRENIGRKVEDPELWQTYIRCRHKDASVLIHQRYKWNLEKEIAFAESLANRWGVQLRRPVA